MTGRTRLILIVAVLAIAVAGFAIARSGSDDGGKVSGATTITVKNGKPVGGIQKINVKKGDPVRFTVKSDVADEIHVHGYDFHKDVPKNGSVSFSFPAKIDGAFVIELEAHGEQIASLTVQP